MVNDQESGEGVLAIATDVALAVFGARLRAVFALGSLAHGGFSVLASDIDLALVVDAVDVDTAELVDEVRRVSIARSPSPLAHRLSIFWSDWAGVRHGPERHSRLSAVDRLDLLDSGRLLHGSDERAGAVRPDRAVLVAESARFACTKFGDSYFAGLHHPNRLVAGGPRVASKAALFPIRFLYTLATGQVGLNDHAADWYEEHGAHPVLARAAMQWREHGILDAEAATRVLSAHLLGVYDEFFDAYRAELGDQPTAECLRRTQLALHNSDRSVQNATRQQR